MQNVHNMLFFLAELAQLVLVAASYPLTIANSIATCLWATTITPLPQSGSCTAFDFRQIDWLPATRACSQTGSYRASCCNIILAMSGLLAQGYVNRTGTIDFQVGKLRI
jgi:hypothetical protein